MLVCVVLISPLLNFMANKVDSLATLDVRGVLYVVHPALLAPNSVFMPCSTTWVGLYNVFTCCDRHQWFIGQGSLRI